MYFRDKEGWLKKARLVAKGFQEEPANNVYAPLASLQTIRLLISIAVSRKWEIRQLDVPAAFLNRYVDDDIYIKTPDRVKNEPGKVLKLKRRLVWLIIWVDDMLVTGERTQVENLIRLLKGEFEAKDLGILSEFLGTMIENYGDKVKISQSSFINKIVFKFNTILCKGVNTPMVCDFQVDTEEPVNEKFIFRRLIGSLMFVATVSRPDISYSVCYLIMEAGKRVLRYLQQTQDLCLTFKPRSDYKLVCYSNSDWEGDKLDRRSVSRCILLHGQNTISWGCIKQGTVALSTAEAEYIACNTAACDLVYLQGVLQDFQSATSTPVLLTDKVPLLWQIVLRTVGIHAI
ncbi:hypothetical protein PR048_024153 [Dryococelus australis]|uniref:Reverse transcriptase Ty1/copia-type domain-containing protein n=1 Tax=Dryococelus australis TaxID=614101 RepID=A0ABQ9GW51_9NEOP|nr:hypothetical protein PR048_024153 [Dryococelus australis]